MASAFLRQLISGTTPPERAEFHAFLDRIVSNEANKTEVVAFLAGLSARPLCPENIGHFVSHYFQTAPVKHLPGAEGAVNIVGTGGGKIGTFNISTAVAFVASAAGAKVLKSGSAAYTSQCGSLDVLVALGVPMPASESELADMLAEFGLGFVTASHYGPLLKQLVLKTLPLSFRDIAGFINTIGPLLCPFAVAGQLIGVGQIEHLDVFGAFFAEQPKPVKTLLVHSSCGLDEFCSNGVNDCRLFDRGSRQFLLSSSDLGFDEGALADLAGGSVTENASRLRAVLGGRLPGIAQNTVVLNSAALLFLAGVTPSIEDGIGLATQTIEDGKATEQLERVIAWGAKSIAKAPSAGAMV